MSDTSLTRIEADIAWLTQEIGPRPAFSSEARLSALGIRDRLEAVGWTPTFVHTANNLVTCKGDGRVLLLAHSDSVPHSPGTLDNAVGVATLIEIARQHPDADLCLGFPAQEEIGLVGSKYLAEQINAWHPDPSQLELVVALDLVGHGQLSVTGLGHSWHHGALQTLLDQTYLYSEYGYQVVSRLLPHMERSDHAPFANDGFLSMQLLGRDDHGVIPHYHLPSDTVYETEAISELLTTLDTIIQTEWSVNQSSWQQSATLGNNLIPWWLIYILIAVVLGNTIRSIRAHGLKLWGLSLAIVFSILAGILASIPSQLTLWAPSEMEREVAALLPISPKGWWMGASYFLPIYLLGITIIRHKKWCQGNAVATFGLLGLGLSIIDPILGLPWVTGSLLANVHPVLGLASIGYWIQPDILRQLTVHGLLPPMLWGVLGIVGFAAILVQDPD